MNALTVKQPWAWFIAHGHKRIENRTWPTSYRGPLAIHAGKSADTLTAHTLDALRQLDIPVPRPSELTMGAIIGVVELVGCIELASAPDALREDPWAQGPWLWILANARTVAPIRYRGQLGLWTPDAATVAALTRKAGAA